jgi:hypothetical protein
MSLREYAEAAGIDHTQLLRLEDGHDIRASAFIALARAHGFPIPEEKKPVEEASLHPVP